MQEVLGSIQNTTQKEKQNLKLQQRRSHVTQGYLLVVNVRGTLINFS